MDGIAGGPPALAMQETGTMLELLRLYRDRDQRDAKIRSLEQALADARRAVPALVGAGGANNEQASQLQHFEETVNAQKRQIEELKAANEAHEATIASMKPSLEESYATIGELRQSKAAQDVIEEQLRERTAVLQVEIDQLRALKLEQESMLSEAHRRHSDLGEQLTKAVSRADDDGNSLREQLATLEKEHAALQERLEQTAREAHAGASASKQLPEVLVKVETLENQLAHSAEVTAALQQTITERHAQVADLERQLHARDDALAQAEKHAHVLAAKLAGAEQAPQKMRSEAKAREEAMAGLVAEKLAMAGKLDDLRQQLGRSKDALGDAREAARRALGERDQAQTELALATARVTALEGDLKDADARAAAAEERVKALTADTQTLAAVAQDTERERKRLYSLLEARTTDLAQHENRQAELATQIQKLSASVDEKDKELETLRGRIGKKEAELLSRVAELRTTSETLVLRETAVRNLQVQYDALQAKLSEVVPKDQHDAQISHLEQQLNVVKVKLVEAVARVSELDAQVLVLKNPHLSTPTTKRVEDPISPTPEPNASKEEMRLIYDLKNRVRVLEGEKATLMKRMSASSSGRPRDVAESQLGDCKMHNTISDVLSAAKDKSDAARIWVMTMYTSDNAAQIPQTDVFLQYHSEMSQYPRLSAVDFFKLCEGVFPGVHIENTGKETGYVVRGMSKRRIPVRGDLLTPRGSVSSVGTSSSTSTVAVAAVPASPSTSTATAISSQQQQPASQVEEKPVIAVIAKDEKKAIKVHDDKGVQYDFVESLPLASAACHSRQKPWVADLHLDFKLWLRHSVLGLSDLDCLHPVARTSAQALRRYIFTKRAIEKVQGLGWETEQHGTFRVPADYREYKNATFTMDSVREAVGVSSKLWEADVETFAKGVDNVPLIVAWLKNPEDEVLLAKFGHMTRYEFDKYKREGETPAAENPRKKKKRPREEGSDGAAKKARLENSATPNGLPKTPILVDSSPVPTPQSSQT